MRQENPSGSGLELTVVMPVYNEEQAIAGVVESWVRELDRLDIDWRLSVYDDGSVDRTPEKLAALAATVAGIRIVGQPNRGHGPTVVRGYREARSEWIFQIDSDGELGPEVFEALWRRRHAYDFLIGFRCQRLAPPGRRWLSAAARQATRLVFGKALRDVNVPYRLMRRERLLPLLACLPARPFAPNVALSGLAAASGLRVFEQPVRSRSRAAGDSSLRGAARVRAGLRSLIETAIAAWRFRTGQGVRPLEEQS